jgi:hypothetical protein
MSKKSKYIVDEIIHKFDSNENSYFSFGSITGEIDANGKDILEPTVTLVIPKSKIPVLFDQFKTAINYKEKEINKDKVSNKEILGKPLIFPK